MGKKKPLDDEQAGEAVPEIESADESQAGFPSEPTEQPPQDDAPEAAPAERLAAEDWAERKGHVDAKPGARAQGLAHMKGWVFAVAKAHAGWGTERCPLEQQAIRSADGSVIGHRNVVLLTEDEYDAAVRGALSISLGGQ
jgi:hypothetical protein